MDVQVSLQQQPNFEKQFLILQNPFNTFAISTDILKDVHFIYETGTELVFTNQTFVPLFSLYGCSYDTFAKCLENVNREKSWWSRLYDKITDFFDVWEELENETDDLLINT